MNLRWQMAVALGAWVAVAGCSLTGPSQPGPVRVTLQQTSSPAAPGFAVAGVPGSGAPGAVQVLALSDVDSLMAVVTRVEALARSDQADSANPGAWQSIAVAGGGRVNLVKLPTVFQAGVVVAAGDLPAGEYTDLRFFLSGLALWVNRQVQVGPVTLMPGTGYPVSLPSGAETGLKTKAQFTVPEAGTQVAIVFDGPATLAGVAVTGSGTVTLAPVLRAR